MTLRKSVHFFILLLLAYTILFLIVGVMGYGWYVMEIATLFLAMGIASGLAIDRSADSIATMFLDGVKTSCRLPSLSDWPGASSWCWKTGGS
jgi:uncharacterized ion transporter superfamily protein YfcC